MFEKFMLSILKGSLLGMGTFRKRVIDSFYVMASICMFFSFAMAAFRYPMLRLPLPFILQASGYAIIVIITIFRKRLNYYFKLFALLTIGMLVAYSGLYAFGIQSFSVTQIILGIVITILLLDFKGFIIFMGVNIVLLSAFAYLVVSGIYRFNYDIARYQYSALAWASYIVNLLVFAVLIMYIIDTLVQGYIIFFKRINAKNLELRKRNKICISEINAHKESLKEKEVLIKEIHHRVKNNLQLISSLLSLQVKFIKDPYDVALFDDSRSRIISIANIHEKLYKSPNLSNINLRPFIEDLVSNILDIYETPEQSINVPVTVPEVHFTIETAIPLGLLINEITSNSIKYAFRGRRKGTVNIRLEESRRGNFILTISDDGEGLPEGFDTEKSNTLGFHLIRLLSEQLKGSYLIRSVAGKGTSIKVAFPEAS